MPYLHLTTKRYSPEEKVADHVSESTKDKYNCKVCDFSCDIEEAMTCHISSVPKLTCDKCQYRSTTKENLK